MYPKIDPAKTVLFVGAGVSQCLGLPSWRELVEDIAKTLEFDPKVFSLFGDYLSLAEYFQLKKGSIGELRSLMDVQWHRSDIRIEASALHEAIVKAGFRKIYTTNFDRWLERACEVWKIPHRRILRASDISSVREGELEIVKFHGDFDDDNSLVLTESSYFKRMEFESPLDLVLRADALRYSMFFIGYSMSDINIRYLFHKLANLWKDSGEDGRRPKSYIFMMKPNPVAEAVFQSWGIDPIPNRADKPEEGLAQLFVDIGH